MLRRATIWERSGIRAAIAGSALASWPNASPMISSCRSTAELVNSSRTNSSADLPWTNAVILSAAARTSQRKARGSRPIQDGAVAGDIGLDVRICDGLGHDEVHRSP